MQRHLVVYHSQILPLEHTAGTCSTVRGRVPDYYIRNNTSCRLKRARSFLMMPGRRLNPKPRGASLLEKTIMCSKNNHVPFGAPYVCPLVQAHINLVSSQGTHGSTYCVWLHLSSGPALKQRGR